MKYRLLPAIAARQVGWPPCGNVSAERASKGVDSGAHSRLTKAAHRVRPPDSSKMKAAPRTPSLSEVRLEATLLDECFDQQGEYVDTHHPVTSFATRYSSRFVNAARRLCELYQSQGHANIALQLSAAFQEASIRSCRGEPMTEERAKYLIKAYDLHNH